jgi:excisionase family DNA binding protein
MSVEAPNRRARRHPDKQTELTPRWASIAGAADYVGCTKRTIERRLETGELTAFRGLGSRLLRLDLNEIDAVLRQDTPT